ncbi:hypothetical protein TRIATDRAFT_90483 [Trichoderma atroviride IMI 206040]|uniref:Uncharacterized protein n=1 Tax=Hypocrea atroviridis (strain ATCC 20476 / IMI 206040) TaxID=452589 RepID=G9NGB3_HYPAI|nr:uncharacterized protein TRIATDRAFT_90483 [Trichoderma atroviride IMI 206040]EHK50325.1 hypothetical protein TRIATDRAFT_90483 [Trichoderma atroviride IMI 206040]
MDNRSVWPTTKDEGVIVGVTAFGLYAETHDFNASNMVLAALPPIITTRKNPAKKVYILKYPEIHVTYGSVSQAVQDIWNPKSAAWSMSAAAADIEYDDADALKVNFVIHLGQMRSFPGYSFEKLANRDGYLRRDLDNQLPAIIKNATGDSVEEQFTSCPTILKPDIDVEVVTTEVKTRMPNTLIRRAESQLFDLSNSKFPVDNGSDVAILVN